MSDMQALSDRLAATGLSHMVQDHGWVIPTVQSVHILCIAVVMASIAMLNMRLAGLIGRDQSVQAMARRFLPPIWWALPLLLLTGCVMIMGEPGRELLNRFFWYKMSALIVVILLTVAAERLLEDRPFRALPSSKRLAVRWLAVLSLAVWVWIVFCGRWIAYA